MKLHQLTMTAFGPFPDTVTIDFNELNDVGLFLMHGPTGSGKTSLLDAICFALYGRVPGARNTTRRLKSDHSEPGTAPEVHLDFSVHGQRYLVTRSPEWQRPKRNKSGLSTVGHKVSLTKITGDEQVPLTTRVDEAAHILNDALGLSLDQFTRVVLLPQGEFAAFLHAKDTDRKDLLENLFGTHRFSELTAWLADQRRALNHQLADVDQFCHTALTSARQAWQQAHSACDHIEQHPSEHLPTTEHKPTTAPQETDPQEYVAALLADIATLHQKAQHTIRSATTTEQNAQRAHSQCGHTMQRLERLTEARRDAAHHETLAADITLITTHIEAAHAAAGLAHLASQQAKAHTEQQQAQTALHHAREQWTTHLAQPDVWLPENHQEPSQEAVKETDTALATATALLPLDDTAQHTAEAAIAADQHLRRCTAELQECDDHLAAAATRLSTATAQVEATHQAPAELELARAEAQHAAAIAQSAHTAHRLQQQQSRAETHHHNALKAARQATELADQLAQQRITGMAAELAQALQDNEPCVVCGATQHPRPAIATGDVVTQEDQQRAQHTAHSLNHTAQEAAQQLNELNIQLAAAHTEARHTSVEDAQSAEQAANERLDRATTQQQHHQQATDALQQAAQAQQHYSTQQSALQLNVATATVAAQEARQRAADAKTAVHETAAPYIHVHQKVSAITRTAHTLHQVHDAQKHLDVCTSRCEERHQELTEQAVQAGFADAQAGLAALLPPTQVQQLEAQVSVYTAKKHHITQTIKDVLTQLDTDQWWLDHQKTHNTPSAPPPHDIHELQELVAQVRAQHSQLHAAAETAQAALHAAHKQAAVVAAAANSGNQVLNELNTAHSSHRAIREQHTMVTDLSKCAEGTGGGNSRNMALPAFVLAAMLEEVTAAASSRLAAMSGGRYTVQHTDSRHKGTGRAGLGISVTDIWTGAERHPSTLSGGETFLASLALALGLADVVTAASGGHALETLFVDEGFGSLDPETLEDVLDVLDELRDGGRTVGLISHVSEMKQRIHQGLEITKTTTGSHVQRITTGT